MSKKILVTGGTGFIGSYVTEALAHRGYHPVVLARTLSTHNFVAAPEIRLGDIRDYTVVSEAMAHVDGWIHLAGVLGTQETISDPWPAIDTNIHGAYNVLEAASKYGLPGVNIAVGNHWMNNPYSITKNLAERFCAMYRDERGTPVTVVRALNAYGPRQSIAAPYGNSKVRKIVPAFVCRALTGAPIEVYGSGEQVMDMVYVADVADVLVDALEYTMTKGPVSHVLEAGTGRPTTVLDIAQTVQSFISDAPPVVHLPMRPGEPATSVVLGHPETLSVLDWKSEDLVPLEAGIAATVDYYRENWLPNR